MSAADLPLGDDEIVIHNVDYRLIVQRLMMEREVMELKLAM